MPRNATTARSQTQRIARLNDEIRKNPAKHGDVRLSEGIVALGKRKVRAALKRIAAMSGGEFVTLFSPNGERRGGTLWIDGRLAYMQIDYHDKHDLRQDAADPADPCATARIMTVSFWDEQGASLTHTQA